MAHHAIEQDYALELVATALVVPAIIRLVHIWVVTSTMPEELTIYKSNDTRLHQS